MRLQSVLPAAQLCDEPIDEFVEWRSTDRPYNEFRETGVKVAIQLPVQLNPAGRDQLARINVWAAPACGGRQLRRQVTVGRVAEGQRNAKVIGLNRPA